MMQITGKHYFVIYNKLVSDFFFFTEFDGASDSIKTKT